MIFNNYIAAQTHLKALFEQNDRVEVKAIKRKRSLKQNAYFHAVVCGVFGLEFGLTIEESKQIFRERFLNYSKKGHEFYKSTTELNTIEFEDFASKCRMFASEQGCFIPLPNEVTDELLNEIERQSKWL
jgi:hypothetical protein